jgi:hypothetical protein
MSEAQFLYDRDVRGHLLEELLVNQLYQLQIPVGYNPYSNSNDPRREDYDFYAGPQGSEMFFEAKMDFQSAFTGRIFVEEKAIRNSKAHKFVYGRLFLDVFDRQHLLEMYHAKQRTRRADGSYMERDLYRHLTGGDQVSNRGMLLDWKTVKANSQPFWLVIKQLKQTIQ